MYNDGAAMSTNFTMYNYPLKGMSYPVYLDTTVNAAVLVLSADTKGNMMTSMYGVMPPRCVFDGKHMTIEAHSRPHDALFFDPFWSAPWRRGSGST